MQSKRKRDGEKERNRENSPELNKNMLFSFFFWVFLTSTYSHYSCNKTNKKHVVNDP